MDNKNILLIVNLALVVLEIIGFILVINELGINSFEYYTEDSNLLLLLSSAIFLAYAIMNKELPSWFKTLRYVAIVSTTLTLIIVLTVLSWTTYWGINYLLFNGSMLYHHTLCPLIALASFIMIEKYDGLNSLSGLIFTVVYAIILIPLNILEIVIGPYPFLMVNTQPLLETIFWTVTIFLITYAIALVLKKGNEKVIISV